MKLTTHALPHAIDDLPTFIGRICSLEAPLDGPVSKSRGRSTLGLASRA